MERNGRLPRGATDKIIRGLEDLLDGLAPYLKSAWREIEQSSLHRRLGDERVVRRGSAAGRRDQQDVGDAPRLAKVSAANSRVTWVAEMEFLRRKMKTATGDQKAEAKRLYDALAEDEHRHRRRVQTRVRQREESVRRRVQIDAHEARFAEP